MALAVGTNLIPFIPHSFSCMGVRLGLLDRYVAKIITPISIIVPPRNMFHHFFTAYFLVTSLRLSQQSGASIAVVMWRGLSSVQGPSRVGVSLFSSETETEIVVERPQQL
jgi:hypothetical protein